MSWVHGEGREPREKFLDEERRRGLDPSGIEQFRVVTRRKK